LTRLLRQLGAEHLMRKGAGLSNRMPSNRAQKWAIWPPVSLPCRPYWAAALPTECQEHSFLLCEQVPTATFQFDPSKANLRFSTKRAPWVHRYRPSCLFTEGAHLAPSKKLLIRGTTFSNSGAHHCQFEGYVLAKYKVPHTEGYCVP
jgi:hypothetical protein